MRRLFAAAAACVALTACFSDTSNLTESGLAKPELAIDFPPSVEAGEAATAVLTVTNPGPGDMPQIAVSFARLGDPELPYPLVEPGPGGRIDNIVSIDPEPTRRSDSDATFFFEGLDEGETATISFEVRVPSDAAVVGNSVQVYDATAVERARGVPVKADVRR